MKTPNVENMTSGLSNDDVLARMGQLRDSLAFSGYPVVQVPSAVIPLDISLDSWHCSL